jgi:maltose-binding protein MalE
VGVRGLEKYGGYQQRITGYCQRFSRRYERLARHEIIVQAYSTKGEFLTMPYTVESAVMYYNKDLFDKFGATYPKDGLTWNETMDLARKLSISTRPKIFTTRFKA